MNRHLAKISVGLCLIALGSGCGGTGTGNPGILSTAAGQSSSGRILAGICSTLSRCLTGVTLLDCQSGVLGATNLEAPLGLTPGTYANFYDIVQADTGGAIHANSGVTAACIADVTSLGCSDPHVQAAKDAFGNYSGVAAMLSNDAPACAGVF